MTMSADDAEFDRLMKLLDLGINAVRAGDGDTALMAAAEGVKSAEKLSELSHKKVICLPDQTKASETL
jgi:hypothetical protein